MSTIGLVLPDVSPCILQCKKFSHECKVTFVPEGGTNLSGLRDEERSGKQVRGYLGEDVQEQRQNREVDLHGR